GSQDFITINETQITLDSRRLEDEELVINRMRFKHELKTLSTQPHSFRSPTSSDFRANSVIYSMPATYTYPHQSSSDNGEKEHRVQKEKKGKAESYSSKIHLIYLVFYN
ncbi:hypothetical protein PanWU01x14_159890, partial [Parasponia andersonii]